MINSFFIYLRHFPSNEISDGLKAFKSSIQVQENPPKTERRWDDVNYHFLYRLHFFEMPLSMKFKLLFTQKLHMRKSKLIFEIDKYFK